MIIPFSCSFRWRHLIGAFLCSCFNMLILKSKNKNWSFYKFALYLVVESKENLMVSLKNIGLIHTRHSPHLVGCVLEHHCLIIGILNLQLLISKQFTKIYLKFKRIINGLTPSDFSGDFPQCCPKIPFGLCCQAEVHKHCLGNWKHRAWLCREASR